MWPCLDRPERFTNFYAHFGQNRRERYMLEPILFSSVLNLSPPVSLNAAARSMKRATRRAVGPDFFSPRPRRVNDKNKQKAADAELEWPPSQCRAWVFNAGQSFWCSKRHRVLLADEFLDSASRRPPPPPPPHIPAPLYRYSSRRQPPRHAGQRRHASGSSSMHPPTDLPIPPDSRIFSLRVLEDAINEPDTRFNLWDAWQAYSAVADERALSLAGADTFLSLAERMLRRAELHFDTTPLDRSHTWGGRLQRLLAYTSSRITQSSPFAFRHRCLLARAYALSGDHTAARTALWDANVLLNQWPSPTGSADVFLVLGRILTSIAVHSGVNKDLLTFLGLEWPTINDILTELDPPSELGFSDGKHRPPRPALHLRLFRKLVYDLLMKLPKPMDTLREVDARFHFRLGNLLVRVFCFREDRFLPAYELWKGLRALEVSLDKNVQLILVRYLVKEHVIGLAKEVFVDLMATYSESKAYMSTGLYIAAHSGEPEQAKEYYTKLAMANLVTREDKSNYLSAYAAKGLVNETLNLWDFLFPKDAVNEIDDHHHLAVLNAYAKAGDLEGFNNWLKKAPFIPKQIITFTLMLECFAYHGDTHAIIQGLERMKMAGIKPGKVTYSLVITALGKRRDAISAEMIFKQARKEGVMPDRVMMNALMSAHAEASSWRGVIKTFDHLSTQHITPSLDTFNILLDAYVSIGMPLQTISRLFYRIRQMPFSPDNYTYALIITAACDHGSMALAQRLYYQMNKLEKKWENNVSMTVYVMTTLMSGYLRNGRPGKAKGVYDHMVRRGFDPKSSTFNAIIRSYARDRKGQGLKQAEEFIKQIIEGPPESRTWLQPPQGTMTSMDRIYTPVLWAYSHQKKPEEVERVFKEMIDAGGEPTLGTLTALLDAYRRTGNLASAEALWPHIFEMGLKVSEPPIKGDFRKRTPSDILCIPLSIYIDLLSAAERHADIAVVWKQFQDVGLTFNSHNYNHLCVALTRAGEIERAFEIIEKIIIPSQKKYQTVRRQRDRHPESPYIFDDESFLEDTVTQPEDNILGSTKRRTLHHLHYRRERGLRSFENVELWQLDEDELEDPVAPLHFLHQVSPGWAIWAPHRVTMGALLTIVFRLRDGLLAEALNPGKVINMDSINANADQITSERLQCQQLLSALQQQFPNAWNVVQAFSAMENKRLGQNRFHHKYIET